MDVLSLEHYFGKEIETSFRQLFNYFCNNINLGQWKAAKACLKQLSSNKKNFQFDLGSLLAEIVENPEHYILGSSSLESPYHLALLLYDLCCENDYVERKSEQIYDRIVFKFMVYSTWNGPDKCQSIVDELAEYMQLDKQSTTTSESMSRSNSSVSSSQMTVSVTKTKSVYNDDSQEFSQTTADYLRQLMVEQPLKAKYLLKLIYKYNKHCQFIFLKVHLASIYAILDQLEADKSCGRLNTLINCLSVYRLNETDFHFESLALVQRCFKTICFKLNALWMHDVNVLDENFGQVYSSLLFEFNEKEAADDHDQNNDENVNLLVLFSKIHYEVDKQITLNETFNDDTLIVLSLVKQYANQPRKEILWRRLFLYSFMENKLLLRSIIDECLLLISRAQYDYVNLIFSVKEFANLKPLVLLLGISKVNDLQSAKKLLASICFLNSEKGTLVEKIGNILRTHLDFIAWFQQQKLEIRKKEVSFNEMIKLLHKQLPLNIISQYMNMTQLDYSEITKMLRNTLVEKETISKTKWVRFIDEVNEKISQIQETCLSIFNGFHCLNETLNCILYCCEHLNSKIYSHLSHLRNAANNNNIKQQNLIEAITSISTTQVSSTNSGPNVDQIQQDYLANVAERLNRVKAILRQISPAASRLEIMENIYSLIYLTSNDLKESEDEDESENEAGIEERKQPMAADTDEQENNNGETAGKNMDEFEILSDDALDRRKPSSKGAEYSIYDRPAGAASSGLTNQSSKSTFGGSYSSSCHGASAPTTNDEENNLDLVDYLVNRNSKNSRLNVYRRNAGGGGSFLVNDFLCRDLLLLLNDALNSAQPSADEPDLSQRFVKFQQLVTETLWRFSLVKSDSILIEFGRITSLHRLGSNAPVWLVNDRQQNLIYELMKKRKRNRNSSLVSSTSQQLNESFQQQQQQQQPQLVLALSKPKSSLGGTTLTTMTASVKEKRRSFESHRTLTLIYPANKYKRSNLTVMKLLADMPTLCTLCLKEMKLAEAAQIVKTFATRDELANTFEYRQILFRSLMQKTLNELEKLNQQQQLKKAAKSDSTQSWAKPDSGEQPVTVDLIEQSLLSLELAKITTPLLELDKDSALVQAIVLSDLLISSRFNLAFSSFLIDFARAKVNTVIGESDSAAPNHYENEIKTKLSVFVDCTQSICKYFNQAANATTSKSCLVECLIDLHGISVTLNKNLVQNSIDKYESFIYLTQKLNEYKLNFESCLHQSASNAQQQIELYFNLMDLLNESIKFADNDDLISTFFYKPVQNGTNRDLYESTGEPAVALATRSEASSFTGSYTSINSLTKSSNNYLLSFYEYCKTLYEYFKEKSGGSVGSSPATSWLPSMGSCFSMLEHSPASLICKLLFEESLKPHLIESLTQKLNLNLTAILLHNSCPRLKLSCTLPPSRSSRVLIRVNSANSIQSNQNNNNRNRHASANDPIASSTNGNNYLISTNETHIYNISSFFTILNQSDVLISCSRKKPDVFVREVLLKLLKYCKNHLLKSSSRPKNAPFQPTQQQLQQQQPQFVDLKTAQEIYQCAEFKTILNESQELQHLNLYLLKTENQKLSFFINLHNLLCIHAYFFLASLNSKYSEMSDNLRRRPSVSSQYLVLNQPDLCNLSMCLFRNRTEELLFRQKFCYKVGQMGCVSLYHLKHHILTRRCLNNENLSLLSSTSTTVTKLTSSQSIKPTVTTTSNKSSRPSLFNLITSGGAKQPTVKPIELSTEAAPAATNVDTDVKLHKNAHYKIDLDTEPLWTPFMPNDASCDYRILFALIGCTESDPPICVYNSDSILDDQLEMQMKLFLNDSIYADLCEDVLYLPAFIVENSSFFVPVVGSGGGNGGGAMSPTQAASTSFTANSGEEHDLHQLIRFFLDHVNQDLRDGLKCLLDLDSIHGFGENIDQYGRKELPFPIIKITESTKFSLLIEYNYSNDTIQSLVKSNNFSQCLWYRREISKMIYRNERTGGKQKADTSGTTTHNTTADDLQFDFNDEDNQQSSPEYPPDDQHPTVVDSVDVNLNDKQLLNHGSALNKECLDYIQKTSPLIANSLSFLFDVNKRDQFFKSLIDPVTGKLTGMDDESTPAENNNSLYRFVRLYVPLDYMKHLSMQTKLNLITQFLLTNKMDESKIELIIDLANHYAQRQEWNIVLDLLNSCTQDTNHSSPNGADDLNDNNGPGTGNGASAPTSEEQTKEELDANLAKLGINNTEPSNNRLSQRDLYNLFDHACVCLAYQEAKTNEKSYTHLFRMKNFLRQIRAMFGLMHLWSIDGCLEMIDFCLTKSKSIEYPRQSTTITNNDPASSSSNRPINLINILNQANFENNLGTATGVYNWNKSTGPDLQRYTTDTLDQLIDCHKNLTIMLQEKKTEFTAYGELTRCARLTLEKYYEHQQIQDAAGYMYAPVDSSSSTSATGGSVAGENSSLNKMKRVCQKCLTWQYAKSQLESGSADEETNELIMDLFLLNDQFTGAKYLINKLNLNPKLKFKLDYGHLKHRLLNLNVSSSIIVLDLDSILKECISFSVGPTYLFDICFKLLNDFKDLNELNNQVLVSLCEFLIANYKSLLSPGQLRDLKILQLTAKIFQLLVQEDSMGAVFDAYKRHHSQPLLIVEQLLMNSHVDLASKSIKLCREALGSESDFLTQINQLLVRYARKALEFHAQSNQSTSTKQTTVMGTSSSLSSSTNNVLDVNNESILNSKRRSPQVTSVVPNFNRPGINRQKKSAPIDQMVANSVSPNININIIASSSPSSSLSTSFKNFYKLGPAGGSNLAVPNITNTTGTSFTTSPINISQNLTYDIKNVSMSSSVGSSMNANNFIMPPMPPSKDDWVKDEDVNECMVCQTTKFTLLNRRHHCRRCGRVVCAGCSQKVTLIDNTPRRTCDDCFRQIEMMKKITDQQNNNMFDSAEDGNLLGASYVKKRMSLHRNVNQLNNNANQTNDLTGVTNTLDDGVECVNWQLMGGGAENESSQRRDEEIRAMFRYQQAPSTSLCLSILDLHDNALECGKDLLSMCDDLSGYLQTTAHSQVEDFGLIINMIKHLLHNAKVKLLQNSSTNMISLCDSYLSLIDVLEDLLVANCTMIPSLNELRNTECVRRTRNRLLEEERHELAMNLSTKCGLDTQTVLASWGLTELRRSNYQDARTRFEKCLKPVNDRNASITAPQAKILNDIINYLENAPPLRMIGPQTLLAPLRSVDALITEPKMYPVGESCLDDVQLQESLYYLQTYGNHHLIASFYSHHGYLENAFHYLLEKKCSSEVFVDSLLVPCIRSGEFYELVEYMLRLERSQSKMFQYYAAIGKYLEKNMYLNTLYDFQLMMKDYVRACMSCICFFTRQCANYGELFNNLHYLNKASKHLEQYLEISTVKQYSQSTQQVSVPWKQKTEQHSLCKQMPTQEVDNYLKAINLQIEVTKFINSCMKYKRDQIVSQKTPTLFGSNDTKINLCCLILLSGQSVQEGFGFVIRIKQCFSLNPTLVYSQIARELAKQFNFKEINNLLKCINESGYKDEINASYDECISACIRVFAAATGTSTTNSANPQPANATNVYSNQLQQQQLQQYNKEIEDLIQLIKDDENKINAYILNGRLKSAYLIAIKIDRADIVKHIANVAERMGQNLIKDICVRWLASKLSNQSK